MNKILWKSIREETKLITNYTENNYLVLIGKIISDKTFSHEIYGESFYVFNLEVPRLSGNEDIISMTNVTKSYATGAPALNGIDLHIKPGEFVFIVGDSGSGKSTMIKLLLRELFEAHYL